MNDIKESPRQFVLNHLEKERWLSLRQLASLRINQRRFLTTDEIPSGYSGLSRLLDRMAEDKEIKKTRIAQRKRPLMNTPLFFHLPTVKAPNAHNYQHEKDCADLYVSCQTTGLLRKWTWEEFPDFASCGVKPDRLSVIERQDDGRAIMWENDSGDEPLEEIAGKVERYIQFAERYQRRFAVPFVAHSKGRARNILLEVLRNVKHGLVWFYVAEFSSVINTPLDPIFVSGIAPEKPLSIHQI